MSYTVTAVALPTPSLIEGALAPVHYVDAFSLRAPSGQFRSVDELARAACKLPRWVGFLLALRHRIVGVFGLKTKPAEPIADAGEGPIMPGGAVGIFLVLARSADEIVMGLDDNHLDFRFSLLLQTEADRQHAIATTTVRFRNGWGRLYFAIVKPFHKLIIPVMLRAALANTTQETSGRTAASVVERAAEPTRLLR
jgi:hypothetical protein